MWEGTDPEAGKTQRALLLSYIWRENHGWGLSGRAGAKIGESTGRAHESWIHVQPVAILLQIVHSTRHRSIFTSGRQKASAVSIAGRSHDTSPSSDEDE